MIYFETITLTALFLIYMFKHFIYTMFKSDRVVLIVQQIVSLILYSISLYYTDVLLEKLAPINMVVNMSDSIINGYILVYISVSVLWGYVATHISNKLIDFIYSKLILPCWNKHKKTDEIFPSNPDCKIIIHFNNSDGTYFNISTKYGIIPSDIKLKKIGTDTYVDKDENTWRLSVYACENISDESRLKQIVRTGMIENLENNL